MTRLIIRHETRYDYDRPVRFGPHRLLIRPRDSHAMRLVDASLELSPPGDTRWVYDAMSNCVCWFTPQGEFDQLRIVSNLTIDRYPSLLRRSSRMIRRASFRWSMARRTGRCWRPSSRRPRPIRPTAC